MGIPQLKLSEYRDIINLDKPYLHRNNQTLTPEEKTQIIDCVVEWLIKEDGAVAKSIPANLQDKRRYLRGLLNIRPPKTLDPNILKQLDRLLQDEALDKGTIKGNALNTVSADLPNIEWENKEKVVLWQGDITRLEVDAIVNAANAALLGCMQALHDCIDNAIHSAAGPQLREDCNTIINLQQQQEETGDAKITRGYNLPTKFVLHTVGPIVPRGSGLQDHHRASLASCYRSCLEVAAEVEAIKSIAFCAISTGVFGFPKDEASRIAISTVDEWLYKHPDRFDRIVFCVFSQSDYQDYVRAFTRSR